MEPHVSPQPSRPQQKDTHKSCLIKDRSDSVMLDGGSIPFQPDLKL